MPDRAVLHRMPFACYNLGPAGDPGRGPGQVRLELSAIANNHRPDPDRPRPKVTGLLESIGYRLPRIHHYHPPIRSTRTKSRANVALYVLARLELGHLSWVDLDKTWPRTERRGVHEPRSILVQEVEDWRVIVAHAPQGPGRRLPRATNDALVEAREEWLDAMVDLMRGETPVIALTDPNGLGDDLVRRLGGSVVAGGTAIEAVHGRGITLEHAHTPGSVNGVAMLSDHRRVLIGRAVRR